MAEWSDYQEEVAQFFRDLGLGAETNVTVQGVRTKHDIDVVVRSKHAGFAVLWLVECKAWKTAIPKEKVLALRTIVDDIGADRGFIMAESGYQSGALEAARFANVMLTSLRDLKETLAYELGIAQLRSLISRADSCRDRYWAIGKGDREDFDLRPEGGAGTGFSAPVVIDAVIYTTWRVMFDGFPVSYDRSVAALSAVFGSKEPIRQDDPNLIHTPMALFGLLNGEMSEVERRLDAAEAALKQRHGGTAPEGQVSPDDGRDRLLPDDGDL